MPDSQYSDKLLTPELRKYIQQFEREYLSVLEDYKDHIAPSYWEVAPSYFNISGIF